MNEYTGSKVLIIDGYSTGRELVSELVNLAVSCLHARSVIEPSAVLSRSFDSSLYTKEFGYLGTPEEAAEKLRSENLCAVVAGSEPGVIYAEALAFLLGLPTNDPALSLARRDKFVMGEVIENAGLSGSSQARITSFKDAVRWLNGRDEWPVVVKPLDSAGSDGVTICHNLVDVEWAINENLGQQNLLGLWNTELMIQSFIEGQQYIVNSVSHQGQHVFTDIWEMNIIYVPGFANAMDNWIIVDPASATWKSLTDYTRKVLDTLGISNTAATSEVRMNSNGPVLIETGARLNGPVMHLDPYLDAGMNGTQASAYAASLVNTERFQALWGSRESYTFDKAIAKLFFIFSGTGEVTNTRGLNQFSACKSWNSLYGTLRSGDSVAKTTSTVGRGGVAYFVDESLEQLRTDLAHMRNLDRQGRLYQVDYEHDSALIH